MTFALPSFRLRLPLLIGATLLLHYVAIGWVGNGMGLQQRSEPAAPAPIVAQLRAPPPPVRQPAAADVAPKPPPKRRIPAPIKKAAPVEAVAQEEPAPAAPTPAAPTPAAPTPAEPTPAEPEVVPETPVVAEEVPAEEPPAEAPAAPLPRQYKANVPPSSHLALELERIDAKGTLWHGVAEMSWKVDGGSYAMTFDAGISMLVTRVNLLSLASEGSVGEGGFVPRVATEKRRGRAQTATHFNNEQGSITFSASQNAAPLVAGAQDKATLPLQLAAIARADPAQFEGGLEITVGEERAASVYTFVVVGQEEIETKLGKLQTWRLSRPPKPGSYNSRLDVWLAPGRGWYPVRIRNTEASGAVTTQTVAHIVVTDSGTANAQ
ncbi:DUF3108 domain-containing protein [Massilia sp. RP-1-19]|uniref:DUF3108 domain-containing protein n=2 Tax=Massilia polaris TaxID=2728846 RepID=A0A848HSK6_9BURK|nr:DUF3108 domain-containing protein [Massilia polaris]NML62721.1 DUF3108 domain-containing protein [Massilia polaris]